MEGMPEEKCALVAELVQVLDMVKQLEAHMVAGQQQGAGDQQCRALVRTMRASIDRAVYMAMSCCAAGQPESPPFGGDVGSPRSAGSDQAGDFPRGRGNAAAQCSKKRKTLPKVITQVRVKGVQDVTPLDDGLSWRKYGQKDILGAKYPRAYFRCTHRHTQSCQASKQVQRTDGDPLLFDVVYHGSHTCAQAQQAAAAAHPNSHAARPPAGAAASAVECPVQQQPATTERPPPFSLVSSNDAGGATSTRLATPQCLQDSTSYAVGGGGGGMSMAGVRNVPDVELVYTTNSPMGELDFVFDADDFLENPATYF